MRVNSVGTRGDGGTPTRGPRSSTAAILPPAVLELAAWTQHHLYCARAETTAVRCTCGLDEAWQAVEELLERPAPITSTDQKGRP